MSRKIRSTLGSTPADLVSDLLYVGDCLHKARQDNTELSDVILDIDRQQLGFHLKHKEKTFAESATANPLLRQLNIGQDAVKDNILIHRSHLVIRSKKYQGIRIDGNSNFRDGKTNTNWAVYKSITDGEGHIVTAALYVPSAGIVYVADQNTAYTITFAKPDMKNGCLSELHIAPSLKLPFTAEYGSWHKANYSIVKTIFTTMVRQNIGGSIRESGMKQLPLLWVANGERGLAVMGNVERDSDRTGEFIAQKAGVKISEIPIESDPESRISVFALHPTIEQHVLEYFRQALHLSQGSIIGGKTRIYPEEIVRAR